MESLLKMRHLSQNFRKKKKASFAAALAIAFLFVWVHSCSKQDSNNDVKPPKVPQSPQLVDETTTRTPAPTPKPAGVTDDTLKAGTNDNTKLDVPEKNNTVDKPQPSPGQPGEPKEGPPPDKTQPAQPVPTPPPKGDVPTPSELENKLDYEDYCRWVKTDAGQKEAIEMLKSLGLKDEEIKGWLIDINDTVNAIIKALTIKNPSEPGYLDPKDVAGVTNEQICTLTQNALNEAITLVLDARNSQIVNPDPISGKDLKLQFLYLDNHKISRVGFLRNILTLRELHLNKNFIASFQADTFVNIQKDKKGKVIVDRGLYSLEVLGISTQLKKDDQATAPSPSAIPDPIAQYDEKKLGGIAQLNTEQSNHTGTRNLIRINNDINLLNSQNFRGLSVDFRLSNPKYLMFTKGDASCNQGYNEMTKFPKSIEIERASRC